MWMISLINFPASCPLGFYNGEGPTASPGQCMACPVDTYLDTVYTATCSNCNDDTTTSGVEGATQSQQCTGGQSAVLCSLSIVSYAW